MLAQHLDVCQPSLIDDDIIYQPNTIVMGIVVAIDNKVTLAQGNNTLIYYPDFNKIAVFAFRIRGCKQLH